MAELPTPSEACQAMLAACLPTAPRQKPPETVGKLLSPKELADALSRSRTYVFAMKRAGFPMQGNRATLAEARAWLALNPNPRGVRDGTLRNAAEHSAR